VAKASREDRYLRILRGFVIGVAQLAMLAMFGGLLGAGALYVWAYTSGSQTFSVAALEKPLVNSTDPADYARKHNVAPAKTRGSQPTLVSRVSVEEAPRAWANALKSIAAKTGLQHNDPSRLEQSFVAFIDERVGKLSAAGVDPNNRDARTLVSRVAIDFAKGLEQAIPPSLAETASLEARIDILSELPDHLGSAIDRQVLTGVEEYQKAKNDVLAKIQLATSLLYSAAAAFAFFLSVMFMFVFIKIEVDLRDIRDRLPNAGLAVQTGTEAVADGKVLGV